MGQISIPFTFDPIKRQIFLTIPYDVKDTGSGYKEMVIPYEYNTNPNEPDIFIPVNVGGSVLNVPINISEPTIKVPNLDSSLGLIVPYHTIPWQQSIEFTGSGKMNIWWEDTVVAPPIAIDDGFYVPPIIDDEGILVTHPIYVPVPPVDEPTIIDSDPPYVTYPEEPDHPIPSIVFPKIDEETASRISIPFIPYGGVTEEEPTPTISIPFTETPIVSEDELYLPPPILAVLDKGSVDNDSQIAVTLQNGNTQIPYTVDPNNANRLLIPYTASVDEVGNPTINVGAAVAEPSQPNESITKKTSVNTPPQINNTTSQNTPANPLAALGVGTSKSDSVAPTPNSFTSLYYPSELQGTAEAGHYVNFYINATNASKYYSGTASGVGSASYASRGAAGGGASGTSRISVQSVSHHRTSVAISLYIPDSMNYSQSIEWENSNVMEAGKRLASSIANSGGSKDATTEQKGGRFKNALKSISGAIEKYGGVLGGGMQLAGYAMNPQLMVLFRAIGFRSFQYDFYFTPKNSQEAEEVKRIIKTFRFHAHPELGDKFGVFYVIPSTFDIEFMHKGTLNTNIHKVKTCVLTHYDIDYAPFGWSTYTDGMPVQTRLTLQFQEVEIVTKEEIEKGY